MATEGQGRIKESGLRKMPKQKLTILIVLTSLLVGSSILFFVYQKGIQPSVEEKLQQKLLEIRDESEYWVAYETPSEHAFSLTWGDGYLWMADLFEGIIYKVREGSAGLEIVEVIDAKNRTDDVLFFQARDLTWDGENLWSVDWGDLRRHNAVEGWSVDLKIDQHDREPPDETLHHLQGIAWDGERIWTALDGTLNRHSKDDFEVVAVYPMEPQPAAAAFKNGELWVADKVWGYIYQLDVGSLPEQGFPTEDGYIYDLTAPVPAEAHPRVLEKYSIVEKPFGLTWSEDKLWIYDLATKYLFKVKKFPSASLDPGDEYLSQGESYTTPEDVVGNAVWTKQKSPYVVEDGFTVPEGSTLTIEPGVRVFIGKGDFIVEGVLRAVGESQEMIVFSHKDQGGVWGDFAFWGREASASHLKYVKVQYGGNGIVTRDAVPTIEYSIIRKNLGGIDFDLEQGSYQSIRVVGNKISEGDVSIIISSKANLTSATIKENLFTQGNAGFIYMENLRDDWVESSPKVVVEHNIVQDIYGVATVFDRVSNINFRHNLLTNVIAYGGVQPLANSKVADNLIEYTWHSPINLSFDDLFNISINYNTIRWPNPGVDSSFGNPGVTVEYNNLILDPEATDWAYGLDLGEMRRNWWGTPRLGEILDHLEEEDRESIEPILTEPNGIGFIRSIIRDKATGKPISEAEIKIGDLILHTGVTGQFFSALPEASHILTVSTPGYQPKDVETTITAAETETLTVELEP